MPEWGQSVDRRLVDRAVEAIRERIRAANSLSCHIANLSGRSHSPGDLGSRGYLQ